MLQSLIPLALNAPEPVRFILKGGTDVPFAPTALWVREIYLPWLTAYGDLRFRILSHGFYPRGGGVVDLQVHPGTRDNPPPMSGCASLSILRIRGISLASEHLWGRRVAERQAQAASRILQEEGWPVEMEIRYVCTRNPGSSITLWGETREGRRVGADALGAPGKPAEVVGREAAHRLRNTLGRGELDPHLADHLLIWVALEGGCLASSQWTPHLESGVYVLRAFWGQGILIRKGRCVESPGVRRRQGLSRRFRCS